MKLHTFCIVHYDIIFKCRLGVKLFIFDEIPQIEVGECSAMPGNMNENWPTGYRKKKKQL